jgi:hypothetical protein
MVIFSIFNILIQNGECETRVEQKVTIQSDGGPIDHDEAALAQAIQESIKELTQIQY